MSEAFNFAGKWNRDRCRTRRPIGILGIKRCVLKRNHVGDHVMHYNTRLIRQARTGALR